MMAGRSPWARGITLALVVVGLCGLGRVGRSDDPKDRAARAASKLQGKAKAGIKAASVRNPTNPGEAVEIFRAFQGLTGAVRAENEAGGTDRAGTDALKAMNRPERTVTAPTLTPAEIDALIDRTLAESKAPAARPTTDEEFVRRAYLDLTGTAPAPDELRAFVASKARHKRAALVDTLLDGPEYAANWARYWRDVIRYRATVNQPRLLDYPALEQWLTEQLAANAPWDRIARELITATGDSGENGATVFTAAHMAQPVEVAGEVSRIFLGVQIQCAQCHDHPSDPWKREQFHEFAAFFAGVQSRRKPAPERGVTINIRKGVPRYTMPDLKDPSKAIPVQPKFFLARGESPVPSKLTAQQRRELAASYVTGQDNPWFAKALVNRVWYALMGDAFVTPVDDMGPNREARHAALLDALAGQFAAGGYDLKWLIRAIMNTNAYQRESRSTNSEPGRATFAANCASRLRSDQIYDQLAALGVRLGGARRGPGGQGQAAGSLRRAGPRGAFDFIFGADPSTPNEDVLGTIPQALYLMNSPAIAAATRARNGSLLGEILQATPDNRAALEALYLRVLARGPTDDEVKLCGNYLARVGDRREAFEDIFWSLINSTEFLSRR
jgi:hypothetical protein